jgi:membrane-associated phospholipid phosphatase
VYEAIQSLDLSFLWWLRSFHAPVLVWAAWAVSTLAWKGWLWWTVIIGSWVRGRRDLSVQLASGLVIATIAGLPLKGLIARPRPDLYASLQLNIPMPELLSTAHSFPSGHTLLASVFAFVIFRYCKDWRAVAAFLFVGLVGLARIYQGLHWPSDVLGSIALGAACAWAAGYVVRMPAMQKFIRTKQMSAPQRLPEPLSELGAPTPVGSRR